MYLNSLRSRFKMCISCLTCLIIIFNLLMIALQYWFYFYHNNFKHKLLQKLRKLSNSFKMRTEFCSHLWSSIPEAWKTCIQLKWMLLLNRWNKQIKMLWTPKSHILHIREIKNMELKTQKKICTKWQQPGDLCPKSKDEL